MTDYRDSLLGAAGRALRREIDDINIKADGSVCLLNAGKELLWTGYTPDAELLKGLIVRLEGGRPVDLVAGALPKFYNAAERAENDAAFLEALNRPGARAYFLEKLDGSNVRPYVHPDSGRVEWATRGMLESGMGASTFGDFSAMARQVATDLYPALLDQTLVSRYTFICELIHPDNQIVTNYGERRDLPVIAVVDLASGRELSRRATVELCRAHGLSPVAAVVPASTDFDGAIAELRASWAGTDFEGVVVTVEHPDCPVPFRLKVKGERYLELMRLKSHCSLRRTRDIAETFDLGDVAAFVAHLQAEMPDLPEEVRMAYEHHFERYIAWEEANRAEAERLICLYQAQPLAPSPDRRAFALSIADLPERWALFHIRDAGPTGARPWLLEKLRRQRERELGAEEADLAARGAA